MISVIYDNSFEGWLTAVFEIYEYKLHEVEMATTEGYQASLLGQAHIVISQEEKCNRVLEGLKKKLSPRAVQLLYYCFLSEDKKIINIMLEYVRYAFSSEKNIELDFGHAAVFEITQTAKKVSHEKHRMEGFVRFQLTKDKIYYAIVEPQYDVLSLIITHFKNRFADQRWLIYDAKRKYGIYYDLHEVNNVTFSFDENPANVGVEIFDEKEELYQTLWQQYFSSINIAARKNTKLHVRCLPRRYWKHLTEKKIMNYEG